MDDETPGNPTGANLEEIDAITEGVPWTPQRVGYLLSQLVRQYHTPEVLEVACGYGKITPYLAHAAATRDGLVRATDHKRRIWEGKSAVDRVEEAGFGDVCEFAFGEDARWYTLDLISDRPGEWINLVYLDISHTIEIDAFVALAVWTHLSPGGIVVFDDLDWTPREHGTETDERRTNRPEVKQMELLFDYLCELPDVSANRTWGAEEMHWRWGFIQKARDSEADGPVLSQVLDDF